MGHIVTRFAPSPTGRLHLGHAASARLGWQLARAGGGRWLVRIEDIDAARCRDDHEAAILEDLAWLGMTPDGEVLRQSERRAAYSQALDRLRALGVVYPCQCSRADIAAAAHAPHGPDGPLYPGTCRTRPASPDNAAWRLDTARAARLTGPLVFEDAELGRVDVAPSLLGDIVVARRNAGVAYHLAVVVDDAHQGVTDVVRGEDLRASTHPQRLLQALLGLPVPRYRHHALMRGPDGQRLSKRDGAATLASMRDQGVTTKQILTSIDAVIFTDTISVR
ncbi:tRNA glutamyl-Q(34) synthetase GluQRS [Polymorphobacter sp.]|uniref:tRNA glutamyl-Q(34) synthetase GluQRS n=1 Tax=Polymorphobacter sp. TaxID=1909290 RepID=UPI003F727B72